MKPQDSRTCSICGTHLPIDRDLCPVCMLREALDEEVKSGVVTSIEQDQTESTTAGLPLRFEHYEILKREDETPFELGRGAMGVTYKAFDVDLRCPVALKVISEQFLGDEPTRLRFLREARVAASVRHSNVASVFHLGRTGESYCARANRIGGISR